MGGEIYRNGDIHDGFRFFVWLGSMLSNGFIMHEEACTTRTQGCWN